LTRGSSATVAELPAQGRLQARADELRVDPWGVYVVSDRPESHTDLELLRRAFALLCERFREHSPGRSGGALSVRAALEIPSGAGLGSSAALGVAVTRAMARALGLAYSDERVLAESLAWERVFHGNPSGVDSAMAVGSGLSVYVRTPSGPALTRLRAARPLPLVISDSGESCSTKRMVERVAAQLAAEPQRVRAIFDDIAGLVATAQAAVQQGDFERLGALFDLNQAQLSALGLSTPKLDALCQLARGAGALGAKLTGGGGGGCAIALARHTSDAHAISRALENAGYTSFVVEVGL
jgi:mevalonate kinase